MDDVETCGLLFKPRYAHVRRAAAGAGYSRAARGRYFHVDRRVRVSEIERVAGHYVAALRRDGVVETARAGEELDIARAAIVHHVVHRSGDGHERVGLRGLPRGCPSAGGIGCRPRTVVGGERNADFARLREGPAAACVLRAALLPQTERCCAISGI